MSLRKKNDDNHDDNHDDHHEALVVERHLGWSRKQGQILTANGNALEYYTAERGFPFQPEELPHYYLGRTNDDNKNMSTTMNMTHEVFHCWMKQRHEDIINNNNNNHNNNNNKSNNTNNIPICGVWNRPLFCGTWDHSTDHDEIVFNIQTNTLFIDLRIPKTKAKVLPSALWSSSSTTTNNSSTSTQQQTQHYLSTFTNQQLRFYARQHVFGGYSRIQNEDYNNNKHITTRMLCTRHHCMDWNYVGVGRPRPNKWWIELNHEGNDTITTSTTTTTITAPTAWKEWAYATDQNGQHYYMERWESLSNNDNNNNNNNCHLTTQQKDRVVLALRKSVVMMNHQNDKKNNHHHHDADDDDDDDSHRDGILVVVDDHFNFLFDRVVPSSSLSSLSLMDDDHHRRRRGKTSLVDVVDAALEENDRTTAEAYLTMDAGHGTISSTSTTTSSSSGGWMIDTAIQPWREGTHLFHDNDDIHVVLSDGGHDEKKKGQSIHDYHVMWNNERWDIYESSFQTMESLAAFLSNKN